MRYVFGEYVLDTDRRELRRAHVLLKLERKVYQVLLYLIEHRDRLVTKEELLDHIWPNVYINDTAVSTCISDARKALGDTARNQQVIQTRHGQGYRFVAPVTAYGPEPPVSALPATPSLALLPPPPPQSAPSPPVSLPPSSRSALLPFAGEYKRVSVLTCTLADASTLTERLGPEEWYQLWQGVLSLVVEIVQRYGGTLQRVLDEGFLAVFGATVTQEDHPQRAVQTAVELRSRLAEYPALQGFPVPQGLTVRIGLHTGPVLVGPLQDSQRLTMTAIGDTLSLPLQLQSLAPPGTILLSELLQHQLGNDVRIEVVGAVPQNWKTEAFMAYKLLEVRLPGTLVTTWRTRSLSRFVGREQELAILQRLLAQAEAGRGQAVGIMGDPGIGKSRLLYEFCRTLLGKTLTYLETQCVSYGSSTPYLPILTLLKTRCGLTEADGPQVVTTKVQQYLQAVGMTPAVQAPYLLHLLGILVDTEALVHLSPQALKLRTFETLHQVFLQDSQHQSLVIAIENLHWIDATSEEYLATLVDHLSGMRVLLLVSYRPGYQPAWLARSYATQLTLHPLGEQESLQVVQSVQQDWELSPAVQRQIQAKAEGNPLFLKELTQTILEQEGSPRSLILPATIQAVIAARMDRLPMPTKQLLQTAAVLGKDFAVPLLQAISDLPAEELHQHLQYLQTAEFLCETRLGVAPRYTFKHVLTQEVAYQSLLQRTRQQIHHQVAQVLGERFPDLGQSHPEVLAHHYTEAGRPEHAIPYWQQAGQRAVERSAYVEAISHLTRGLELLEFLPDTSERTQQELDLQLALGPAFIATKGQAAPEVERIYRRARDLCQHLEETTQLLPTLRGLWMCYLGRAELQSAQTLATECFTWAQRQHDSALHLWGHYTLGATLFFRGELSTALVHMEQGSLLSALQHPHSQIGLYGYNLRVVCGSFLAWILWMLGYPDRALQHGHQALTWAQEGSHPFSLAFVLYILTRLHQWRREEQQTLEHAKAALHLSTQYGFIQRLALVTILQGWALAGQEHHYQEGLTQIQQGLETWHATGAALLRPYGLALLAEVYSKTGQINEGLRVLTEALALVDTTGERHWEAELYRLKGELLLQSSVRYSVSGVSTLHPALRTPDLETEAETCFHQALAIARRQQAKSLELRAAMSLSRLWQQQGKRTAARHLLADIYGWFAEGFDTADLREARTLLNALN
jgi:class 3 adenylate cyclase/predicted ATPase